MLRHAVGEFGARVPTRHYTTGRMTTYNPSQASLMRGLHDRPPERHRTVRGASRSPLNNIETLQGRIATNKQTNKKLRFLFFVCLFVTTLHCKVSMALSGDLVAPLTDLCTAPEVCPTGPRDKEAQLWVIVALATVSHGQQCI